MRPTDPARLLRRTLTLFFTIFIITGAIISGLIMVFYQSEVKTRLSRLEIQEEFSVNLQGSTFDRVFSMLISDLIFLSRQNELMSYFESGDQADLVKMGEEYLAMSEQKGIYDQIRYIDSDGTEKVRVNYNHGAPRVVAADKLQNKMGRYYFKNTLRRGVGEVYISPFDLNVENGRIEQPFKPMIRIGTPVFDKEGRKRGVLLLNYLGANLLNQLTASEQVSIGQTMLLNDNGYWLLSPDSTQEWGFMFNDSKLSFTHLLPEMWRKIRNSDRGQHLSDNGLFTHRTIYPLRFGDFSRNGVSAVVNANSNDLDNRSYRWHLVSRVPDNTLELFASNLMTNLFLFGAGIFIVITTGAWFLAYAITRRKLFQDQLRAMALYDSLTDLPNRRLFNDRLVLAIKKGQRYKGEFGLLYIDLDGFKEVNDSLGHAEGDSLLREVGRRLRKSTRDSDTVARLGGDEFAIIADNLEGVEGAVQVAKKIIDILSNPISLSQGEINISASIGISHFPSSGYESKELIRQADWAMYHSKRNGKNNFTVYEQMSGSQKEVSAKLEE